MSKKKFFDCWTCKYMRTIPGDAHIACMHPSLKAAHDEPMNELMAIFASVHRVQPFAQASKALNIVCNPHGFRSGWFNFPWNFDPVWLENCDGYEKDYKWFKKDEKCDFTGISDDARTACKVEIDRMDKEVSTR